MYLVQAKTNYTPEPTWKRIREVVFIIVTMEGVLAD